MLHRSYQARCRTYDQGEHAFPERPFARGGAVAAVFLLWHHDVRDHQVGACRLKRASLFWPSPASITVYPARTTMLLCS